MAAGQSGTSARFGRGAILLNGWFIVLVGAGGAIGALARYGVGRLVVQAGRKAVWGTLAVNLIGTFAAGLFFGMHLGVRSPAVYAFAVPGMLGGLTTYSTLNVQKAQLAAEGRGKLLLRYASATYVGGWACAAAGAALGTLLFT